MFQTTDADEGLGSGPLEPEVSPVTFPDPRQGWINQQAVLPLTPRQEYEEWVSEMCANLEPRFGWYRVEDLPALDDDDLRLILDAEPDCAKVTLDAETVQRVLAFATLTDQVPRRLGRLAHEALMTNLKQRLLRDLQFESERRDIEREAESATEPCFCGARHPIDCKCDPSDEVSL